MSLFLKQPLIGAESCQQKISQNSLKILSKFSDFWKFLQIFKLCSYQNILREIFRNLFRQLNQNIFSGNFSDFLKKLVGSKFSNFCQKISKNSDFVDRIKPRAIWIWAILFTPFFIQLVNIFYASKTIFSVWINSTVLKCQKSVPFWFILKSLTVSLRKNFILLITNGINRAVLAGLCHEC